MAYGRVRERIESMMVLSTWVKGCSGNGRAKKRVRGMDGKGEGEGLGDCDGARKGENKGLGEGAGEVNWERD